MQRLKSLIKTIVGSKAVDSYHRLLSFLAAFVYNYPSEKLVVIGVTGTNGKSTTVNLIAHILKVSADPMAGKVAVSSTVNFGIAQNLVLNDRKMTMPGRFFLQRLLARAVKQGCKYAVLEVTSQGLMQHRHEHINFDVCVFTNLTPEHIEAHGGFENYKQAKLKLFKHLERSNTKILSGKKISKVIVTNADDPYGTEFAKFRVDQIVSYGQKNSANVQAQNLKASITGIEFIVNNQPVMLALKGRFDMYNALAALAVSQGLGFDQNKAIAALKTVKPVAGRMEIVSAGDFNVLVDYAPEPASLNQMYDSVASWPKQRIIHVLGSTGGGRDISRRPVLGEIAAKHADVVIVTNEDPYDDDPLAIIEGVAIGASKAGKILDSNLYKILDRRQAIAFALSLAKPGDLVIVTGKGSEQKMAVRGGYVPWDDRHVVREELVKIRKISVP